MFCLVFSRISMFLAVWHREFGGGDGGLEGGGEGEGLRGKV